MPVVSSPDVTNACSHLFNGAGLKDNLFSDYRIESNTNNNTIALELNITPLVQALRSTTSKGGEHRDAAEVMIKLLKKGTSAALGLDVRTQTKDGKETNVLHEVHVLVRGFH
jgi:hypothetical protein